MAYVTEFKGIPGIGELKNEQTLFEYAGVPIIFVCKSPHDKQRYLCICTDSMITPEWLITRVETEDLIRIIEDTMPVMDSYKDKNVIVANMNNTVVEYAEIPYDEIDKGDLPDLEEKLENPHLGEYKRKLLTDMKLISFNAERIGHHANEGKLGDRNFNYRDKKRLQKTILRDNMLRAQFG